MSRSTRSAGLGTDEYGELRGGIRDYLASCSPSSAVRELMNTEQGFDRDVWRRTIGRYGYLGINIPEQYGGGGGGIGDVAAVCEELAAPLFCGPFYASTVLAARAVLRSDDAAACERYLPALCDGSSIGTLVMNGTLGPWDRSAVALTASGDGEATTVSGEAGLVLDGLVADIVVVVARSGDALRLLVVDGDGPGLTRSPLATLDRTRKLARLTFAEAPAVVLDTEDVARVLAAVSDEACVALGAEQLGGAAQCLDMATEYATDRIQFGRAIGSFQAVKHRCADMLVAVESARSAVTHAAAAAARNEADLATAASITKMYCSETYTSAATESMRIHGGIGFTWEHDCHLFVRRAKSSALMLGSADHHAERLAQTFDVALGNTTSASDSKERR